MRRILVIAAVSALLLGLALEGRAQQISGDYVESRSADVYTGSCFANAEVGLTGDQAILAWRVNRGEWNKVRLDGLSIVGVVKASATLGDPHHKPLPARAVVIIDERATQAQQLALLAFARGMAGGLLNDVVRVELAPIRMDVRHEGGHPTRTVLQAGELAAIETRLLDGRDHVCGNEETYYPPLTPLSHAMPAVAALDAYNGPGLGATWTLHGRRSAFVGSFDR